jgi:hypothetical protein
LRPARSGAPPIHQNRRTNHNLSDLLFFNKPKLDHTKRGLLFFNKSDFSQAINPMKKFSSLAACLRVIFGVCQLLILITGTLWTSVFLFSLPTGSATLKPLPDYKISLKTPSNLISIKSPTSSPQDIRVRRLTGELEISVHNSDPQLAAAARWILLPRTLLIFVLPWMLFGLLRKICARVEQGEIFSEANFRSIRNLGLLLVGWSLADVALAFWANRWIGDYLVRSAAISGLDATLTTASNSISDPLDTLVTGLLVLLVAEAFRQGLALKKENELTV